MGDNRLEERLEQWGEESGRTLELRVARRLWEAGAGSVEQSAHYVDVVTEKAREADVVGHFPWSWPSESGDLSGDVCVCLEAKHATPKHPWVGFVETRSTRVTPTDGFVYMHGGWSPVTTAILDGWVASKVELPRATHVVTALGKDEVNPAFDAVRQAASVAAARRAQYVVESAASGRRALVLMAGVVTMAPLWLCTLDEHLVPKFWETDAFEVLCPVPGRNESVWVTVANENGIGAQIGSARALVEYLGRRARS